ncbi:Clathrin coat assembly protein AP180 [Labeo rohita]|uniref:Clathrin coat assembly protein AP180 n=1 Tax=Labeo rohita TaxID=84645 RepID=A0ABQ8LXT8_LABRO|nr:Clathrin coat assembly protein AP180 [Labeo rohita]
MADTLFERAGNASWIVVFKALVTTHHLMVHGNEHYHTHQTQNRSGDRQAGRCSSPLSLSESAVYFFSQGWHCAVTETSESEKADGSERQNEIKSEKNGWFIQYLASRNTLFNLSNFLDKTGSHGYDMSTFIRRYSRYLNEKAFAYRQMAFDFGRVKKGADGVMRTMSTDKLLKGMPTLQSQIDALLEFDVHPKDLVNGVINAAFLLLFKDLIKLYACYNDGIINLLVFNCVCKRVREWEREAPESLLESLETHLNTLEGKKKGSPTNNGTPAGTPAKSAEPTAAAVVVTETAAAEPAKAAPAASTINSGFNDLVDFDLLAPTAGASAAPTASWGDSLAAPAAAASSEAPLSEADSASAVPSAAASATEPAADAIAAPAAASLPVPAPAATISDMDLFGDAFAPSPGDGPSEGLAPAAAADACAGSDSKHPECLLFNKPSPFHFHPPTLPNKDPWAPSEGSASIAPELDLFAMKPVESVAAAASPTSAEPSISPTAAPATPSPPTATATTTATTTTTTSATTESVAPPTLDLFSDMFDSMPEQSSSSEPKATTPSVDLFGADSFVAPAVAPVAPTPAAPAAPVSPPKAEPGPVLDLLDTFGDTTGESQSAAPGAPSGDLLGGLISPVAPTVTPTPAPVPSSAPADLLESAFDAFGSVPVSATPAADSAPATAAPSGGFDASVFDGLEDLLMPAITPQSTGGTPMAAASTPLAPGIVPTAGPTMAPAMAPAMVPTLAPVAAAQPIKPIGGDLDSSLANLVGNLGVGSQKKDNQWNEKKLTGGANWTPQAPAAGAPMMPQPGQLPRAPKNLPPRTPLQISTSRTSYNFPEDPFHMFGSRSFLLI